MGRVPGMSIPRRAAQLFSCYHHWRSLYTHGRAGLLATNVLGLCRFPFVWRLCLLNSAARLSL